MAEVLPLNQEMFKRALATKGLKIVFGTDAVAGAHGQNARELVARVKEAHVPAMQALISAQSLAAEALGLGTKTGSIAPGCDADIIAVDGDPLADITATQRAVFVMKKGDVVRRGERPSRPHSPSVSLGD